MLMLLLMRVHLFGIFGNGSVMLLLYTKGKCCKSHAQFSSYPLNGGFKKISLSAGLFSFVILYIILEIYSNIYVHMPYKLTRRIYTNKTYLHNNEHCPSTKISVLRM